MTKKVGVILSGCGVFDGTEIHEAVLTLLFLDRAGAQIVCAAPDVDQIHVLNHMTNEEMDERRNVLIESARIARGNIMDLKALTADRIDALISEVLDARGEDNDGEVAAVRAWLGRRGETVDAEIAGGFPSSGPLLPRFCLEPTGGVICTADCNGGGFANCSWGGVEAGSYTATLGGLSVSFTVPSTVPPGGICDGSPF